MARIGYRIAKYNQIDSTTKKYKTLGTGGVPVFEKVSEETFAPEFNNAELYAFDALAESDYSFNKGTLTLTIVDDDDTLLAELFGSTNSDGEVTRKIDDSTPEFGYGHIITKVVASVKKYKVEFFPRVKFTKITSDNKSRGESVEFSTSQVEGTVFPLGEAINGNAAGTWEIHKTFSSLSDATSYLDGLLTPSGTL